MGEKGRRINQTIYCPTSASA